MNTDIPKMESDAVTDRKHLFRVKSYRPSLALCYYEDEEGNLYPGDTCGFPCGTIPGDIVSGKVRRNTFHVTGLVEPGVTVFSGTYGMDAFGENPSGRVYPTSRKLPDFFIREIHPDIPLGTDRQTLVLARRVLGDKSPLCDIVSVIGDIRDSRALLESVIEVANLPTVFSAKAQEQAAQCAMSPEESADRLDLRDNLIVTIDGEDAKDFDDAVSLEHMSNGHLKLGVHIADVGHFVPQGTPLDRDAFQRGTSVYFPGMVIPMLPEELCNGLCSLRPGEDKYTLSAFMEMTPDGEVVHESIHRTIIRSRHRLIYSHVNAFFEGNQEEIPDGSPLGNMLKEMLQLSKAIRERRIRRGAIDFDLPEIAFRLDEDGNPVEVMRRERGDAELMIEDFMLAANSCVARFLKNRGIPALYRIHEEPTVEKMKELRELAARAGLNALYLKDHAKPDQVARLLREASLTEMADVVRVKALRCMQKARYEVSPMGHFGLAEPDYCHFTSPIRRYPDLVVSRALGEVLRGHKAKLKGTQLQEAANQSSETEVRAQEAERNADKALMALWCFHHQGESFEAKVSGVVAAGCFAELPNGVEGFAPVRRMSDWYLFDEDNERLIGETTGQILTIGTPVKVSISSVSLANATVDLDLEVIRQDRKNPEKRERRPERRRGRGGKGSENAKKKRKRSGRGRGR